MENKADSAILAVFPGIESFHRFTREGDSSKSVQSFADYAFRNNLIDKATIPELEAFIEKHESSIKMPRPNIQLSFEELFDQKENLLDIKLSARALTSRINILLNDQQILLPNISNSMLTRLKREPADTPHKLNVLRSLAFWIGYERAGLGSEWNFETLVRLCGENRQTVNFKEGVRIGFALYGRGDVIDHEIVNWLKKEIRNYIEESIEKFLYGRWGKVKSLDITTLYVDFPKEGEFSDPASFRQCLMSAISLAHQLSIRWALSRYFTKNRFLSIGITTGEFERMDKYLIPILNTKLPEDPVIRMTDYTRQCLLINDIRASLCVDPHEITLFNGEGLSIWWVIGFWSMIYYDFIPELLEDTILQNKKSSTDTLNRLFWYPQEDKPAINSYNQSNAVSSFLKTPQNALLGIEIAKTLFYRRRYWEAIEVLRVVLSIYPNHPNARSLRMVIIRNLALNTTSYQTAENMFRQAIEEAEYIGSHCAIQSEDFFCEHALIYMAYAMLTLRYLRSGKGLIEGHSEPEPAQNRIIDLLETAETLFYKGLVISPSGVRSIYLLNSVKIIKSILNYDGEIFVNPAKPIDAPFKIIQESSTELHRQIGYFRDDFEPEYRVEFLEKAFQNDYITYDDSVSLKAYRPATHHCGAVSRWDFLSRRTVGKAKTAIHILNRSIELAARMAKKQIGIYSFTRTYGEMMAAEDFIDHIEQTIQKIKETAGEDLNKKPEFPITHSETEPYQLILTLQL